MLASKAGALLGGAHHKGRIVALLGRDLQRTNTLAYPVSMSVTKKDIYDIDNNIFKLFFCFENYNLIKYSRVFVHSLPFQPSLMFASKTEALLGGAHY